MNMTFKEKHASIVLFGMVFALLLTACGETSSLVSSESSSSSSSSSMTSSSSTSLDENAYQITNGDFESGDLTGWTVLEGQAFGSAGLSESVSVNGTIPYGKEGTYFYKSMTESFEGKMKSENFVIGGSGYISFLLGAAYSQALTYISIVNASTDIELFRFGNTAFNLPASGTANYRVENLVPYYANLSASLGTEVYILLVDQSTTIYGYLSLDSVITYYPTVPSLTGKTPATNIMPVFPSLANTPNTPTNQDFATGTLSGWTVTGESGVFQDSHINANHRLSNRPDETKVGTLRSSAFKVAGSACISFRLGATKYAAVTYLSVKKVGTNEEVFRTYSNRWKDTDEENTHLYFIDFHDYVGEALYLEFVDNSRGDWGLLSIEQIQTYYVTLPEVTDEIAVNLLQPINLNPTYTAMRDYINPLINGVSDLTTRTTLQKSFYATIDGISNNDGNWGTVLRYNADGSTFVITGDIDAMWLRDSSVQAYAYLPFMNLDSDVRLMVKGILKKQFEFIRRDPYANAFNSNGTTFERKFEIDSLIYPLWLADKYYEITGDGSIFDAFFLQTLTKILNTLDAERHHSDANYMVPNEVDRNIDNEQVNLDCGLIWSGYRPSDDVTYYKYFIPGNMFAVATLEKMHTILDAVGRDSVLATRADTFADSVRLAIEAYATYNHPAYGKIYAFEVNGMNNDSNSTVGKTFQDMANIPSLLSIPWLGYVSVDDATYQRTRSFILSSSNPYYFEGTVAKGIGDQHQTLGGNAVWPMAIAMQGLTSTSQSEIEQCIAYLTASTGGMYVMHEAVNPDSPNQYSRKFFTWPCALYAHLYLSKILNVNII